MISTRRQTTRLLSERLARLRRQTSPPLDELPLCEAITRLDWPDTTGPTGSHASRVFRWLTRDGLELGRTEAREFTERFPTIGAFRRELALDDPRLYVKQIGPKAIAYYQEVFGVTHDHRP